MTWFKVDDGFAANPRLEALEGDPRLYMAAVTVWVLMGADCAQRLTDGRCSISRVRKVCIAIKTEAVRGAEALVRIGLWERVEGGYQFRNWDRYQPSKDDVKRQRAAKTERQRRWRQSQRVPLVDASTVASRDGGEDTSPSRPDPTREEEKRRKEGVAWGLEVPPLRAPEPALTRESPPAPSGGWTSDKQSLCFQKAYLARRQTSPAMGGKNLGDFHQRVLSTAEARGIAPEKLFRDVLERWLSRELNERERSAPYACFSNAFGELVDQQGRGMSPETRRMQEQAAEALRVVRGGR